MPSTVALITDADFTIAADGKKFLLPPKNPNCRATCTKVKWELLKDPKEPVAIDVEFQEFRGKDAEKWGHRMGRVAVVNSRGQVIYDTYASYDYDADTKTKMPPRCFGVERKDLYIRNGAKQSSEVEGNLKKIFHGRPVIGHGMRLDRTAVGQIWAEEHEIHDTQSYYGQVALGTLAATYLDQDFNFHDPTEDARATMLLYLRKFPYNNRTDFNDAPFKLDMGSKDFPSLAEATRM